MLQFKKLVKVINLSYQISINEDETILELYNNRSIVNTRIFVLIENINQVDYLLDLDELMVNETIDGSMSISELISDVLTPEMLYTYQTGDFNFINYIKSFSIADLKLGAKVEACHYETDEVTNLIDDPTHSDIRISATDRSLDKVLPIIDGRLYPCEWTNDKIYVLDKTPLLLNNPDYSFLSFERAEEVIVKSLSDLQADSWEIPDEYKVMMVLDGKLIWNDPWVYQVHRGLLELKETALTETNILGDYDDIDEVIALPNSFVIMVKCKDILSLDIPMIRLDSNIYQYCTFNDPSCNVNFVCTSTDTNMVHGITMVKEKYVDLKNPDNCPIQHCYLLHPSDHVKLTQFTIV